MRVIFALFLMAHGISHLPGFIVLWRLKTFPELPYKTTLFGGMVDVGDFGIKVTGSLWLLAGAAFVLAGIALWAKAPSWRAFTLGVTVFSLVMTLTGWPEAKIGLFLNVAILVFLTIRDPAW